jgi:hypothetical protein
MTSVVHASYVGHGIWDCYDVHGERIPVAWDCDCDDRQKPTKVLVWRKTPQEARQLLRKSHFSLAIAWQPPPDRSGIVTSSSDFIYLLADVRAININQTHGVDCEVLQLRRK